MDLQPATDQPVSPWVTLEERSPRYGWRSYWLNVLLSEIVLLLLPGAFILGADSVLFWFSVAAVVVLPIAMLCAWSQNAYLRSKAGTVTCSDGKLSTVVDSNILSVSPADCRWYYGRDTRATVHRPREMVSASVPAILIEFPHQFETEGRDLKGKLVPTGPVIVAVGYDDESRQAWEEVLSNSGAVHDLKRESMPSPPSSAMYALVLGILVPASVMGIIYVGWTIEAGLVAAGLADDFACKISGSLVMPGILIAWLYLFLLFRMSLRRYCVTDRQRQAAVDPLNASKTLLPAILLLCGILPLVRSIVRPGEDLAEGLIQALVTLILTGLAAFHFHFLLRKPKTAV